MAEDQGEDVYEPVEARVELGAVPPHHELLLVTEEDRLSDCAHHVEEEEVAKPSQADPQGHREGREVVEPVEEEEVDQGQHLQQGYKGIGGTREEGLAELEFAHETGDNQNCSRDGEGDREGGRASNAINYSVVQS